MSQNTGAVQSMPPKRRMRELVDVVPRQFLCEKVLFNAA